MKSSLRSDEIQGKPWMKSNPSKYFSLRLGHKTALTVPRTVIHYRFAASLPCEAGFHRESDFIHQRWISPVEDGFDCVILR
jgi:hypothetical protein